MPDGPPDRQQVLADADLMEAIAAGDTRSFEMLMRTQTPKLVSLGSSLLASRAEAEEVAQDAFLRLWRQAGSWRPEARISTWLHRVTYRLAIDRLRQRRPTVDVADIEDRAGDEASPEEVLLERQQAAMIDAALARLAPRQRAAVVLAHGEGLSQTEAAAVLELTEDAYESLLARGRRRLKELVGEAETGGAGRSLRE